MKNQSIILIALVCLCVGGAIGYVVADGNGHGFIYGKHSGKHDMKEGMDQMPDGTFMNDSTTKMEGMDHSAMMVTSERAFIEGMIPHHLEAVLTAKEVTTRGGTTPEIKALAEAIVSAQEKEIAEMKQWYQTWYGTPYTENNSTYKPMMRELGNLNGIALDKTFLEDMIMHHKGAIMMAESVTPYIEHAEMKTLTEAIISSQSKEIKDMREMLKGF